MDAKLHVIATDYRGGNWSYEGSRPEVETWLDNRHEPENMSVVVADETGVTVGRKHFGERTITWGLQLEA